MNLNNMSADELADLAKEANQLAADLRKAQPTYELALAAGIRDRSYQTVRNGEVASYSGEAIITMDDGRRWRATGHGPSGDAYTVTHQGGISFTPLD